MQVSVLPGLRDRKKDIHDDVAGESRGGGSDGPKIEDEALREMKRIDGMD